MKEKQFMAISAVFAITVSMAFATPMYAQNNNTGGADLDTGAGSGTTTTTSTNANNTSDDEGMDLGWIGLLGLAGLKRKDNDRDNTNRNN